MAVVPDAKYAFNRFYFQVGLTVNALVFLFDVIIGGDAKGECVKRLLQEQRELLLQVAGNSITAQHLQQILFVYRRYLVALLRTQKTRDVTRRHICKTAQVGKAELERKISQVCCCFSFIDRSIVIEKICGFKDRRI